METNGYEALAEAVAQEAMAEKIGTYAFPTHRYNDSDAQGHPTVFDPGMSLRAYFAVQTPSCVIDDGTTVAQARIELYLPDDEPYNPSIHWPKLVAKKCCAYADALIAELAKETPNV